MIAAFFGMFAAHGPGVVSALLEGTLKGTVAFAIAAALTRAMRRGSAAARHRVWVAGLLAIAIMPLASRLMPAWSVAVPADVTSAISRAEATVAPKRVAANAAPSAATAGSTGGNAVDADWLDNLPAQQSGSAQQYRAGNGSALRSSVAVLLAACWMLIAVVLLARLLAGVVSVARLTQRAGPLDDASWRSLLDAAATSVGVNRSVQLVTSDETQVPMTWGIARPVVVLTPDCHEWTVERRRSVLRHELAHVARVDMATHLAAQVCCALYWFNPMVWIAARALRRERERACDDRVLTAGTSATDYATELLDIARAVVGSEGHAASLAMARRSQLEGRLLSILDPRVRRGIPGRTSAAVLAVSALVLAIPLAAFQPAAVRASAPPTAVLRAVSRLGERAAPVDSHQAVSAVSQGDPVAVRDPEAITAGHDAPVQQRVPIRALSAPTARSREPVANIIELRELPGQKVLVNLPFQARLFLLDSALASYKVLMDTTGSGAMRYPNAAESIIRFVGDSTLFGDPESRSFVVVSPTGELGRAVAAPNGRDFVSIAAWQAGGRPGTDAQGRIVYQAQAPRSYESANPLPGPLYAAVVIRADFATRSVDTIAHIVNLGARRYANRGTRDVSTVINPLQQAIDDWAVLSDGSIAIVRGHDYHIDWVYPDGTRASTPAMPFDWRRVTEDEKKAKLDSARRMIDSLRAANADPFQIVTFSATRTDTTHPRLDYVTPAEMADYVPPIRWGTVKPDVDGNLWILPSTSLDAKGGLLYDVVNKKGELFQRVQLPPGRNIAGFGRGGVVYMVAKAENGQWYLERSKVIR